MEGLEQMVLGMGGYWQNGPLLGIPLVPVDDSLPDNNASYSAEKYPNEDKWYIMRASDSQQMPEIANENEDFVFDEVKALKDTRVITIQGIDFKPKVDAS